MTDLLVRKFAGIDRYPPTSIAQLTKNPSTEGSARGPSPATVRTDQRERNDPITDHRPRYRRLGATHGQSLPMDC